MPRTLTLVELQHDDRELVRAARDASMNAYAPYSGFAVGAALRTIGGEILFSANLENASYGLSICAETSVVAMANGQGKLGFSAIAVVGHKFVEPKDTSRVVTPCGRCRQIILEAAQISDVDIRVLSCNADLTTIVEAPISELVPMPFGPANLGLDKIWPTLRRQLIGIVSQLRSRQP